MRMNVTYGGHVYTVRNETELLALIEKLTKKPEPSRARRMTTVCT